MYRFLIDNSVDELKISNIEQSTIEPIEIPELDFSDGKINVLHRENLWYVYSNDLDKLTLYQSGMVDIIKMVKPVGSHIFDKTLDKPPEKSIIEE
jgi:hypothetical protein